MSKPKLPEGNPLPPVFKVRHDFEWFRRFTLRERLRILIGFNFKLTTQIFTVNSPGIMQPIFIGETTMFKTPEDQAVHDALQGPPKKP